MGRSIVPLSLSNGEISSDRASQSTWLWYCLESGMDIDTCWTGELACFISGGSLRVERRRRRGTSSITLRRSRAMRWRAPGVLSGPRRFGSGS